MMKSVREQIRQNLERPISDKCYDEIENGLWNLVRRSLRAFEPNGNWWATQLVNPIEDRINEIRKRKN